ncbi:hypothetical protein G6F56_000202 [Rhizopus delemar]|uniref:Uncharacterized protein n=1 Tax=Rhizopus stolonifer TaxID=4846 RepID=A0A367KK43_RHIST|nr:hypothetical protein G6F56_000202 [Rhizopus delemar]RCI02511.1 hypothetical protein CU098_012049 [Rhizopus stolonifer]
MVPWTLQGLGKGVGYAIEGIRIVLHNPNIRKQRFIKVFVYLSIVSFIVLGLFNVLISTPIHVIRFGHSVFKRDESAHIEELLSSINEFIRELMASIPLLAILFMRYVYPKPLDELFIESLRYIDETHPERPQYASVLSSQKLKINYWFEMKEYVKRTWKKSRIGLVLFLLSFLPVIGAFVFPLAGAYTSYRALGKTQGIAVGICFFFLPRWATMKLVRALIGMRSLMRELLEPYFIRMHMTHREKRRWFSGRKDVLFSFSAIAYVMVRAPIIGIVGYGLVQAAAAYMLTVVTEPPTKEELEKPKDNVERLNVLENSNKKLD